MRGSKEALSLGHYSGHLGHFQSYLACVLIMLFFLSAPRPRISATG